MRAETLSESPPSLKSTFPSLWWKKELVRAPDEGGEEDRGDRHPRAEAQQEEDRRHGEAVAHAEADVGEARDEGDHEAHGKNREGRDHLSAMPEALRRINTYELEP
jgi:hypothetical protein